MSVGALSILSLHSAAGAADPAAAGPAPAEPAAAGPAPAEPAAAGPAPAEPAAAGPAPVGHPGAFSGFLPAGFSGLA